MAQTRDGEIDFWWQWHNEHNILMLTVLMSVILATILVVVKTMNEGIPDSSQRIQELWGIECKPGANEGPQVRDMAPIFNDNITVVWLQSMTNVEVRTVYCVLLWNNQVLNTPMQVRRSFLPHDKILPQEEEMIDDIGEAFNNKWTSSRPRPRSLPSSLKKLVARDWLI
jgi:hypothetical protein